MQGIDSPIGQIVGDVMGQQLPKCLFAFVLLHAAANASPLVVGGLSSSNWVDPNLSSPTLHLNAHNGDGNAVPLGSWSLTLRIVPLPGSSGSVDFEVAAIPTDYLLLGRGLPTGPMITQLPMQLSALDVDLGELFGLPPLFLPFEGAPLLDVGFVASADAHGAFAIEMVPFQSPDIGSYWTTVGEIDGRPFANEPLGTRLGTLLLGSSVSSVPESNGLLVWLLAMLPIAVLARLLIPRSRRSSPYG